MNKRYTAMLRKALENILQDCKGGKSYENLGLKDKFFDSIEENVLDAIFALDTLLQFSNTEKMYKQDNRKLNNSNSSSKQKDQKMNKENISFDDLVDIAAHDGCVHYSKIPKEFVETVLSESLAIIKEFMFPSDATKFLKKHLATIVVDVWASTHNSNHTVTSGNVLFSIKRVFHDWFDFNKN